MKNQQMINKITLLILSILSIASGLYWIWQNLHLLYLYHTSSLLFLIMYPDWVLIIQSIIGLLLILNGILIQRKRIRMSVGLIIIIGLYILATTLNIIPLKVE